jgi:ferredoxin-NADP reductase
MQKISAKLVNVRELANSVKQFDFDAGFDAGFDFKAGQFVLLKVDDDKEPAVTRAYSIASAPVNANMAASKIDGADLRKFSLCVKLIEGGRAGEYLREMKVGDEAEFQGPFGHFVLNEQCENVIFVATGVGIAPFMSMLEVLFDRDFAGQMTLYFGVRNTDELFYEKELAAWEAAHENFKVVKTLSRPEKDWNGERGRVTAHLADLDFDTECTDVFICGNGMMVKEVKGMMEEKGLAKEQLHFEMFTPMGG